MEAIACQPHPVEVNGFNPNANIPYGCTTEHIRLAMNDFIDFLGFINQQLYARGLERFETMLMPANFSSLVGEFMITSIPKYCFTIAKNQYHNGSTSLNCSVAVPHFNNIINGWRVADLYKYADRAQQKKSECLDRIAKEAFCASKASAIESAATNYPK